MSPEHWKQVEEIFSEAVDLPAGAERASFIAEQCGADAELRAEVEKLLSADEEAGEFIAGPAFDMRRVTSIERLAAAVAATELDAPMVGRRIGSYRMVREIGRGGMGAVYLAVRADDEYRKRVAIKLVKRGMDTDFILSTLPQRAPDSRLARPPEHRSPPRRRNDRRQPSLLRDGVHSGAAH